MIKTTTSLSLTAFSAVAAVIEPTISIGSTESTVAWLLRGLLSVGLLACAYLLRDAAKTMQETKKQVGDLAVTVATHHIMFEHWVNNLDSSDVENEGRRKSHELLRAVLEQMKGRKS